MTEISFGASFKKFATVKKLIDGKYTPLETSIVQIDYSDLKTITKTARAWKRPFAAQVEQAVEMSQWCDNIDIFVLTKQADNFKELHPEDILGMVYFSRGNKENNLSYLQVHPDVELKDYNFLKRINNVFCHIFGKQTSFDKTYKKIGTSLVRYLQETYNDKKMKLAAVGTSKRFYKKLGFKSESFPFDYRMVWECK